MVVAAILHIHLKAASRSIIPDIFQRLFFLAFLPIFLLSCVVSLLLLLHLHGLIILSLLFRPLGRLLSNASSDQS
jgi:hypothetical protein